jgi:hypothetical protein
VTVTISTTDQTTSETMPTTALGETATGCGSSGSKTVCRV